MLQKLLMRKIRKVVHTPLITFISSIHFGLLGRVEWRPEDVLYLVPVQDPHPVPPRVGAGPLPNNVRIKMYQ